MRTYTFYFKICLVICFSASINELKAQNEKDELVLQKLMEKLTEYTESEGTDLLDISDQIEYYF